MDAEELKRLVHELEVHQIELELQSVELQESQLELAKARDRYADLYEFAPVGYLTVAPNGKVLSANLTAAKLLAATREEIVKGKLTDLVAPYSQDPLYHAWNEAKEDLANVTCELEMLRGNLPEIDLEVELMPHRDHAEVTPEGSYSEMRVTLKDISQKKTAERNLAELNAKLEQEVELRSAAAMEREQRLQSILDTRGRRDSEFRRSGEHLGDEPGGRADVRVLEGGAAR